MRRSQRPPGPTDRVLVALVPGGRVRAPAVTGSVTRTLDVVVLVGTRDEYIVEDDLCTCDRSRIRNGFCRHRLAARIAVPAGLCEDDDLRYDAGAGVRARPVSRTGGRDDRPPSRCRRPLQKYFKRSNICAIDR